MTTDFWNQFEEADNTDNTGTTNSTINSTDDYFKQFDEIEKNNPYKPKIGTGTITATPKKHPLTDFINCLKWVNQTRLSAYQEGKNNVETANLETKEMFFNNLTDEEKERLNILSNSGKSYEDYGINEHKHLVENETDFVRNLPAKSKKAYVEALRMLPYIWATIKSGGIGAGVGALVDVK